MRAVLLFAFFCSGATGLIYELVWSRYLALLVGHSTGAQVLVIAMFLGATVAALRVGDPGRRVGLQAETTEGAHRECGPVVGPVREVRSGATRGAFGAARADPIRG
jgi:hypothetical protein